MALSDYHLFAIPCAVKETGEGISFSELENDLGDSYYDQALFGSETGNRRWVLTLPSLSGASMDANTVTGINGETLTREAYLWDLYCETKVTGQPFAYQSTRNGQYYLVRFADRELLYQRFLAKLYSTGVELKQWRLDGETCFAPEQLEQVWGSYSCQDFPGPFGIGFNDDSPNSNHLDVITGDVISATSGSREIVRFSSTTNDGIISSTQTVLAKDIFLLMKMREATFSNFAGIISADTGVVALLGDTGETTFFDLGFGADYTYRLNGVEYAENDQQAPMNAWGAVHLRHTAGIPLTNLQLGQDRGTAGRFAEMDLAYLIISDSLFPKSTIREIDEFLAILRSQLA